MKPVVFVVLAYLSIPWTIAYAGHVAGPMAEWSWYTGPGVITFVVGVPALLLAVANALEKGKPL